MDGIVPVMVEDRESLDSLCGEKEDLENEVIKARAEAVPKEEEKAKGEDSCNQFSKFLNGEKVKRMSLFLINILKLNFWLLL